MAVAVSVAEARPWLSQARNEAGAPNGSAELAQSSRGTKKSVTAKGEEKELVKQIG